MGKIGVNSTFLLGLIVFASLIFVFNPVFAEPYGVNHSISFDSVGKAITLNDNITNPYDYPVSASIEFVFENIDSENNWESKKHTDKIEPNSNFGTHQSYFIQNIGKFYIHVVYKIDGKITKDSQTAEFVIFEKYSNAALNGCGVDHELVVKPNYSQAVCVFDESVGKLSQRGWVTT